MAKAGLERSVSKRWRVVDARAILRGSSDASRVDYPQPSPATLTHTTPAPRGAHDMSNVWVRRWQASVAKGTMMAEEFVGLCQGATNRSMPTCPLHSALAAIPHARYNISVEAGTGSLKAGTFWRSPGAAKWIWQAVGKGRGRCGPWAGRPAHRSSMMSSIIQDKEGQYVSGHHQDFGIS